jgi:hypothetical protein
MKRYCTGLGILIVFQLTVSGQTFQDCLLQTTQQHIKKPYLVNSLETNQTESLIVREDGFDCVTFVEYTAGTCLQKTTLSQFEFETILTKLRYRNGKIDGYGSRIHYFSEWLIQAEKMGIGKNISKELGGRSRNKEINFMSLNQNFYPSLTEKKVLDTVMNVEKMLSATSIQYIPSHKILDMMYELKTGDLIAFTSRKKGLDIHHTGWIVLIKDQPHILHASQSEKRVEISGKNIFNFVNSSLQTDGIIVFRFNSR